MKKKKAETQSEDVILLLPHYIIVDIFCRIPTKKVLQFKTVCKSWLSLLSNNQFRKDLFAQTPSCFLMFKSHTRGVFIVDPEKASSPDGVSLRVPDTAKDSTSWMNYIVGSCNGLLCIRRTHFEGVKQPTLNAFYILNPVTGETLALPRLKKMEKRQVFCAYGFGLCPVTHKYKLLVILHPHLWLREYKVMVLTVGSKSWRNIGSYNSIGNWTREMVYLNGCLHSFDPGRHLIHVFNIESERFHEFQVSVSRELTSDLRLEVLGGCLSLTEFRVSDSAVSGVWVMKDYGIKESWCKEFEIRKSWDTQPLKFTEGKLILECRERPYGKSLMAYTPGTISIEKFGVDVGMPRNSYVYRLFVPNLVSLKDILGFS